MGSLVWAPGSVGVLENGRYVGQAQFTPMVPGDDQLVPYGQDTTVSVTFKQPSSLKSDEIVSISVEGQGIHMEAKVTSLKRIVSKYSVKNNSQRTISQFYIDHTASSNFGGFEIVTKTNSVKAVTGFCRYEFKLSPSSDVEFEVVEEAKFEQTMSGEHRFRELLSKREALEGKVIDAETLNRLDGVVQQFELIRFLRKCEAPRSLSSADWQTMKEAVNLPLPGDINEAVQTLFDLRSKIHEVQKKTTALEKREQKIVSNQERIRTNIISMEKVQNSGEVLKRYTADMVRDEDELASISTEKEACEEERAKLEASSKQQEFVITSSAKKHREKMEQVA